MYDGGPEAFMRTPLQELIDLFREGALPLIIGKVFTLDEIVEAHRTLEENRGEKNIAKLKMLNAVLALSLALN